MYPTSTPTELFVKCVRNNKYTYDPSPSPGIAVGRPYLHKNTIMWKITEGYSGYKDYQIEWDTDYIIDSSGYIVGKVQLEAKKTNQSSYTTVATYNTSLRVKRVTIPQVVPTSQYDISTLRIKIGMPVKYKVDESAPWNKIWIWSILNVGSYVTSDRAYLDIFLGHSGGHEKITGAKDIYYISDIRIYVDDRDTGEYTYDEFYSPIACRNDLLRFSSVSKHFSSITDGTEVVKPIIKTDEYGIPSMVIDVGTTKSGSTGSTGSTAVAATHYYLKLNTKIPTTLALVQPKSIEQAVRYTDLKDEVIAVPQSITMLDPGATYYTITWNSWGGQYQSATSSKVVKGKSLGYSLGEMPFACKEGYYFAGWYTASSGGTQVSSSTKPTANATYYARYRQSPVSTTNGSNYVTCDSSGNVFLKNDTYK